MKKIQLLLSILFLAIFSGCSTSDDSTSVDEDSPITASLVPGSFTARVDDIDYTFTTITAVKVYDNYEIYGQNENDDTFFLSFNQNGVLDRAEFSKGSLFDAYITSYYNVKSTFDLSNLRFDVVNKVVAGSFNGEVYESDLDVSSDSRTVNSGTFSVAYQDTNANADLDKFIDATINGNLFESIKGGVSGTGPVYDVFFISDGPIYMGIVLNENSLSTGTYNFTSNSTVNKVNVSFSDPYIAGFDSYEELDVTGTLIIESVTEGDFFDLVRGKFTVTGTRDNGEVYNIQNGTFNLSI